jgi:hypothetical protein
MRVLKLSLGKNYFSVNFSLIFTGSEGFEPRFLYGWGRVLVHLPHNLNVGICPLKREILKEWIVNCKILRFVPLPKKILIVEKMEFPQ